ncbi:hypothetical protein [Flavobacterium sp. N3904]|uniref:hypothetical protein n=1 Tax=Flavobacterium sp. N3904 TaxID=2986835 RepID=UPI0022253199|nr:hypothetical protein [Flavobacterium sp. N3904]
MTLFGQVEKVALQSKKLLTAPEIVVKPEKKLTASLSIVYPNLSRGILLNSDKISFQPNISYQLNDKWSFGVWISTNLSSSATAYNEYDWSVSYQVTPQISVVLSDYYNPATLKNSQVYGGYRTPYFDYSIYSAQSVEVSFLYDSTNKKYPFDFQWNTIIYGDDFKDVEKNSSGEVISKERAYSSYSEIGYTYTNFKTRINLRPFVGAAVINNSGYYGFDKTGKTGFAFINVGLNVSRNLKFIKNYTIPVFIRYTYNQNGNLNRDRTQTVHNFISGGITFNLY